MTRYLTEQADFKSVAPIFGAVEVVEGNGNVVSVAMLQRFVRNQGDAWTFALQDLKRSLAAPVTAPSSAPVAEENAQSAGTQHAFLPRVLGERTAELHLALSRPTDDADFAPEPMTAEAIHRELDSVKASAKRVFAALERLAPRMGGSVQALLAREAECLAAIEAAASNWTGLSRIRIHGDFHLGQVLLTEGDVIFVDFEGEPARTPQERRAKYSPLQDVAGMLRSFAYASAVAARDVTSRLALDKSAILERAGEAGRKAARQFLDSYRTRIAAESPASLTPKAWHDHLRFQLFKKALYEVEYEANNRPDWVTIPIEGLLELLSARGDQL